MYVNVTVFMALMHDLVTRRLAIGAGPGLFIHVVGIQAHVTCI